MSRAPLLPHDGRELRGWLAGEAFMHWQGRELLVNRKRASMRLASLGDLLNRQLRTRSGWGAWVEMASRSVRRSCRSCARA